MPNETKINAHVIETGESDYAVQIEVNGHALKGDEPVASGGGNLGPAPYDMLLAALGECTAMTVRWYAKQKDWPLEKAEVNLTHHKQDKVDIFEKEIIIHGNALTPEQRTKLIEIAAKCPVQRTLEGKVEIRTV